jgi:two-component system sensor histidine kinase BaeS
LKRKHFWKHREHGPHRPWAQWDHDDHHGFAEWRQASPRKRAQLFLRLLGVFGFMVLLVSGGMAALVFVITRLFAGDVQTAAVVLFGACGVSLALPLLGLGLGVWALRNIAMPLADLMTAADAVAGGDLTVRVPVRGGDEFDQLAESFNRMTEGLEQADRQRRNLTADVAHELRTPLQIIQGNLEGILDKVYEPTADHISATLDETRLLARLVDDLGTLSLAEAGQLPMLWERVDVAEVLEDVGTSFSGQAEAAGVDLRIETGGDATAMTIRADVGRLEQVLGNLVANALRFTPSGGTITLRAESAQEGVRITVRDTGEGIPAEDLPAVFDRFWRGDRSRSHAGGGGSGLGLAIVRQFVQAHGGRVDVESAVGQGTTFTVELPADGK